MRDATRLLRLSIAKHFRRKSLQRRPFLPCILRQACLAASLFYKSHTIPMMFHRHLGQEQSTASALSNHQSMHSNLNFFWLDRFKRRKNAQRDFQFRRL